MIKNLGTLTFVLFAVLGGAAAFADGPAAATPAKPAEAAAAAVEPAEAAATDAESGGAVATATDALVALEPTVAPQDETCAIGFSDASEPLAMTGCQGGQGGSCDDFFDCRGYFCPLGSFRCCVGGTGSGCEGTCACCG